MEIDWGHNGAVLGTTILWLILWIGLWNIVELTVELTIDKHKDFIRSKYIVYTLLVVFAVVMILIFGDAR